MRCKTDGFQSATTAAPMVPAALLRIDAGGGRWCVLHTRARNEKALAVDLDRSGLCYFLPLVQTTRRHGRRRVEVWLPLFPGYVFFAYETDEQRVRALQTNRIATVIEAADQDRLCQELEQIRRALASQRRVALYPGIRKGRRCRVTGGSLKGLEGVVMRRGDTGRIFLDVAMLGQSAVVEIDVTLLEPAGA